MKIFALFFFILSTTYLRAQNANVILGTEFDKVVSYEYTGGEDGFVKLIDEYGKPTSKVIKEVILNDTLTSRLNSVITSGETFGGEPVFCFNPRMGFIYFKEGKQVLRVDICLECSNFSSTKEIPASKEKWALDGDGNKQYPLDAFSFEGTEKLEIICRELGFEHCD